MTNRTGNSLAALLLGALGLLFAGCGGGGGGGGGSSSSSSGGTPTTNLPPQVTSFTVSPTSLAFNGGQVTYTVQATDADSSTLVVTVKVTLPDGSTKTLASQTGAPGTFQIAYTSPGNTSSTGQAVTYTAVVTVSDGANSVTGAGANYIVAPPSSGPPPPPPPVLP